MKLERIRGRDEKASWRSGMSSRAEGDTGSAVGSLLKASRLRCGEELADVAQNLRIRQAYLQALEDGRFQDLPGPTYAVGFVRTYAEHLGLAGEEVVRRFKAEASGISRTSELVFPSPVPEGGVPGGALLLLGVLLAGIAYGGWYALSTKERTVAEVVPALPDRLVALVERVRSGFEPTPLPPPAPQDDAKMADPPAVTPMPAATVAPPAPALVASPPPAAPAAPPMPPVTAAAPSATESEAAAPDAEIMGSAEVEPPPQPEPAETLANGGDSDVQPVTATIPAPPMAAGPAPTATTAAARIPPATPSAAVPPPPPIETGSVPAPPAETAVSAAPSDDVLSARAGEISVRATPGASDAEVARLPAAAVTDSRHIVVHAKTDSWIQVRDEPENQLLLTGLLQAGDTYEVPDRPGLTLQTGNAGALEITVDGEAVPSIGPIGAVRRNVALDAVKLLEGTASPQ